MAATYQVGGVRACLSIIIFSVILLTADATNNTSNGSNGSNGTAAPVCHVDCCDKPQLKFEAKAACKSLAQWGVTDTTCFLWEYNAIRSCKEFCSNCTEISNAMYDQCLFFLQRKMPFPTAIARCKVLGSDFLNNGRCASACECSLDDCFSNQGKYCMQQCGNYQACECFKVRGVYGEPDSCSGETVLDGLMPGTSIKYSCVHTPLLCKNHLAPQSECAKYKHCTLDMCLVKNVSCDITDDCQAYGVCEKSTGKCFYTLKPDGSVCNDGKYYTHDDTCVDGSCVGWTDRCLRDGVECGTTNPCLKPLGTCSARTGACIFVKRLDGTPCAVQPGDPHNGACEAGVCRRPAVHKCLNKTCPTDGGPCLKAIYPRCDPETGNCRWIWRPEGYRCDDGNPNTFNDMCIEGQCVGDAYSSPKFESIGEGHCANQHGHTLHRYFRDAFDDAACAKQCSQDPTCVAYGFGYHQCSIYGGPRALHPQNIFWGKQWLLGNMWGDMSIDNVTVVDYIVPLLPEEPKVKCMRKVASVEEKVENTPIVNEIVFGFLLCLLVCSPASYYGIYRLKKYLVSLDERYLAEHEHDERPPVQERGCNRLRCKCLRRCFHCECCRRQENYIASDETLIQPMEAQRFVEEDTEPTKRWSSISNDQDVGHGPTPMPLQAEQDGEHNGSIEVEREKEPQRGCCSRCSSCCSRCFSFLCWFFCAPCRCCASCCRRCCRRKPKTTPPSGSQDLGGPNDEKLDDSAKDEHPETPVHIETLLPDTDQPTSLQPALSPRETGKGSSAVAMAPNTGSEDDDPNAIRDPRGQVEPDVQPPPVQT